jgi:purine-nucleoside phosphorylase
MAANNITERIVEAIARHSIGAISTLVILGSGLAGCYSDDELAIIGTEDDMLTSGDPVRLGLLKDDSDGVLIAIGRRHFYEGAGFDEITEIVRRAASLGARRMVVTNAAGGLDPGLAVGDIMLIEGVIASLVAGRLRGSATALGIASGGIDRRENERVIERALAAGVALKRGTYAAVTGPCYETRAEIGMLRKMGADAVGMSTVPEIIAARSCGMSVVGLSLITNVASDTVVTALDHDHVLASGRESARRMRTAIEGARRRMKDESEVWEVWEVGKVEESGKSRSHK